KVRRFQLENLILHFGRVKLSKLTEPVIESYKMKRLSDGADKVTINTELNVLSAVMTYARDTLKVPCAHPKIARFKIAKRRDRVECWTREEVLRLLETTQKQARAFHPMFLFLFETGVRKSEAVALQWKRVDFAKRIIRIWNDETEGYEVKSVEREVPISTHMLTILKAQKLKNGASPWVFPCSSNRFEGVKGERLYEFPDNTWTRIVKLAGLKGGPHKARHTYASHFLASKPDLFLLGRILGHSHSRVTELYAHLIPEHLAEARDVVSFTETHSGPILGADFGGHGESAK
ncbi:MAG: site-specific integrase, partial [Thaumarchaeota archaeon]|nr:site-specific integrase [Nitrososphaerota archaeon]